MLDIFCILNIDTLGGTEICNEIEAAAPISRLEVVGGGRRKKAGSQMTQVALAGCSRPVVSVYKVRFLQVEAILRFFFCITVSLVKITEEYYQARTRVS